MGRKALRGMAAGWLVLLGVLVSGCGVSRRAPSAPPRVLPPAASLPSLALQPAWSMKLRGPTHVTVAADASVVAGLAVRGGGGGPVAWARGASGQRVPLAATGAVFALAGGHVLVGPGVADRPGPMRLVAIDGRVLWEHPAVGPVVGASDVSGNRVAVLDTGAAKVVELRVGRHGANPLAAPALASLDGGTSIQFNASGEALVQTPHRIALLSATGKTKWLLHLGVGMPSRTLVLDGGGGSATVATRGGSATLYGFRLGGGRPAPRWSVPLPTGGRVRLAAGPGGRVAVWGAGPTPAVAVYADRSGRRAWRDVLSAGGSGAIPQVRRVAFAAGGTMVVAASGCDAAGRSCLLVLSQAGVPLGVQLLSPGARVRLATDGRAAVAVEPAGGAQSRVVWYDLPGASRPAGA